MKPLLNREQARAVVDSIVSVNSVGGRVKRIAIPTIDGCFLSIRIKEMHEISVFLIDTANSKALAYRRYACLERFVAAHAEVA